MSCTRPAAMRSLSPTSRRTRRNTTTPSVPIRSRAWTISRRIARSSTPTAQQIEIYSRAHGDAYAYAAPFDDEAWATLFARITGVQTFESITTPAFSEDAIALEFAERHGDEVRYTAQWGKWHLWDGQRWAEDRKRKIFNMARTICREVAVGMKGGRQKEDRQQQDQDGRAGAGHGRPAHGSGGGAMGRRHLEALHARRHGRSENRQDQAGVA